MKELAQKRIAASRRAYRTRSHLHGTSERPRLSVFVSNLHVSAQLIDDDKSTTLASATTVGAKQAGTMTEKAAFVGTELAKKAKKSGVTKAVFDRGAKSYQGRVKALADAAREGGLEF